MTATTSTTMSVTTNATATTSSTSATTTLTSKSSTPANNTTTSTIRTSSTSANVTSLSTSTSKSTVTSSLASTLTTSRNATSNLTTTLSSTSSLTSSNITSTLSSTISTIVSKSTPNITTSLTATVSNATTSLTTVSTALTTTFFESSTPFEYDYDAEVCNMTDIVHMSKSVTVTFYTIIFILGLLGNFMVLMTIVWNRRITFASDIYFLNLAISDLLFVCTLPFWIMYLLDHDIMSHVSCVIMTAIFYCALFASTVFLLLIILDRCYAILWGVDRADYRSLRNATGGCVLMWGLCIVLALPHFVFLRKGKNVCVAEYQELTNFYVIFINTEVNLCTLILPTAAIIYWYLKLTKLTKSYQRLRHRLTSLNIILAVAIVFAIFWLPYNLLLFVHSLEHMQIPWGCASAKVVRRGLIVTESIALCHCFVNPFIYVIFGHRCRSEFCYLLRALLNKLCPSRSWGSLRPDAVSLDLSHMQVAVACTYESEDCEQTDELQFLI
ncbi:US28 [Papio ursinus cytomegalovirus]|uniref:US28 n=1 Tax=Papiine betaherpesvirus 4 TaxID=2560624 RepID=A0A0F7CSU7_9BETA|nr:US28 [Papio ursinus cytomegalovirus]AKG51569.1 US28 [Papiine betaherpesvirus 4]